MAVAFREKAENSGSASATATGNRPTGTTDDDVLIASVMSEGSGTTVSSVPTGWTLLEDDPAPADFSMWCYIKVASSEPASWDWTLSASGLWRVDVLAYSGASGTPNDSVGEQAAATNTITLGPATSGDNSRLIGIAATDATTGPRTWTNDRGAAERIESSLQTNLHLYAVDLAIASGGGDSLACTVDGSAQDIAGFLISLVQAAAGGGPTVPLYVARRRRIRTR